MPGVRSGRRVRRLAFGCLIVALGSSAEAQYFRARRDRLPSIHDLSSPNYFPYQWGLGDHVLATAFQINSGISGSFSVNDIAFEAEYLNLDRRWNWGMVGGQVPYVGAAYESHAATGPGGEPLEIDQQIVYRQTERSASGILAYAFDKTRRLEFRGGFARTSFEQTLQTITSSLTTGKQLSETNATEQIAPSMNVTTTAVALVGDRANFGPTSPVQGERYRFEIAPAFGTINYTGVLVDYRRYVMPLSFYTIAARVLHYGRYGEGGEDARPYPVYIDNPAFVRGYNSLDYTDCVWTPTNRCPLADSLVGSRIMELDSRLVRAAARATSRFEVPTSD
jgi:hypothetical protein